MTFGDRVLLVFVWSMVCLWTVGGAVWVAVAIAVSHALLFGFGSWCAFVGVLSGCAVAQVCSESSFR